MVSSKMDVNLCALLLGVPKKRMSMRLVFCTGTRVNTLMMQLSEVS